MRSFDVACKNIFLIIKSIIINRHFALFNLIHEFMNLKFMNFMSNFLTPPPLTAPIPSNVFPRPLLSSSVTSVSREAKVLENK